jgi:hypothetical protein
VPNDLFFSYQFYLYAPNGTHLPYLGESNFLTTPWEIPTERVCITVKEQTNVTILPKANQVGTWQVALEATWYYGKNGYEYQTDDEKVCVSPPYTSKLTMITPSLRDHFNFLLSDETATVIPITVQVVNSSTPLDPTSTEVPEPTRIRLNDTITGEPFTASPTPTTTESLSSSVSSDPQIGGRVSINRGFTWWSILTALALSLVFN